MSRSRYAGFYKRSILAPKRPPPQPLAKPLVSMVELHREWCERWKPRDDYVAITNSKCRDWLVYDATADGDFGISVAFGSPRALVRF